MNRQQKRWLERHPNQMNPNNKPPSEEEQKVFEAALNEVHNVSFKKRELIAIFNILTKIDMKYGDSLVIVPIVQKLESIVAVESNITKRVEEAEKNHILGTKDKN